MNQKSAWYMEMRFRKAMLENDTFFQDIVEVDETYVGGKPRKGRDGNSRRGGGTKKTPVVGVVEMGGRVVAQVMEVVNGENLKISFCQP